MVDVTRYLYKVICVVEGSGTLADVTFKRISTETSGEVDEFYGERDREGKIYLNFEIKAHVAENPRQNIYGPGGGEKIADLQVIFYGDQGYTPHLADHIVWRGEKYESIGVERIHPTGANEQLGWIVKGRRY